MNKKLLTALLCALLTVQILSPVRAAETAGTSEVDWTDLAFPFVNSDKVTTAKMMPGFGYEKHKTSDGKPYRIPFERYTEIFSQTAQAIAYYNSTDRWKGSCYGMAVVAALLYQHQRQLNSTGLLPVTGKPHEMTVDPDTLTTNELVKFIEAIQVSQQDSIIQHDYAKNKNRYDDLVSEVRAFQRSQDYPVLIAIGSNNQAHALLGYKAVDFSETETRIMVYDCNLPGPDRWITLEKDSQGHYYRWYYRMNDSQDWGPKYDAKGSWISYVPYSDFYQTWVNRPDVNGNSKEQLLTLNVKNAAITDEYGELKAEIKDGVVYTQEDSVYPMVQLGVTADAPLTPEDSGEGVYVWLPTGHQYTITNRDGGTMEATLVHVRQYATVNTSARDVAFYVDDTQNLNSVELKSPGAKYEIELYSTMPNTTKTVQLSGSTNRMVTADGNPLSFAQVDGQLYGDNLSSASLKRDGIDAAVSTLFPDAHEKIAEFLPFVDVPEGSNYYQSVSWAVKNNITKGTAQNPKRFSPDNPCKHDHILTFLWRANDCPSAPASAFPGLNTSGDFGKAALWAAQQGLISPDSYRGNDACTRAQAVMYLWILAKCPAVQKETLTEVLGKYTDVSESDYCAQAVAWAVNVGITRGTSETTFSPQTVCTRGQIVTFLYRCYADN